MMHRPILKTFSVIINILAVSLLLNCSSPATRQCATVPLHPIEKGVSAPFAGFIGNFLIVGGGCNFPNVAAADGGTKVYYDEIFGCNMSEDSLTWTSLGKFPQPVAYGATVETPKGLICIGGMNENHALTDVYRVELNQRQGTVHISTLPPLPVSVDNASATCIKNTLYVTGGNQSDGKQSVYALCMEQDRAWTKITDYPGPQRIQPVLLASDDSLYLLGGFSVKTVSTPSSKNENTSSVPVQSPSATKEAIIPSDFMIYSIKHNTWSRPQKLPTLADGSPRALVGSSGVRIKNQLFIAGGVNYTIFKAAVEGKADADYLKHPASWYRFSKDLLIYDLPTSTWNTPLAIEGFNKAGASLLHHGKSLYMVCGEEKPGIRTSEIISTPIHHPSGNPVSEKNK